MTSGFRQVNDFTPLVGWELYQITLDKYHVMFLFEGGRQLLNVAHQFSHRSADGTLDYSYRTAYAGGSGGMLHLDRLLRERVTGVAIASPRELEMTFSNDDVLVVHDHPSFRSWWLQPVESLLASGSDWAISDDDGEWD